MFNTENMALDMSRHAFSRGVDKKHIFVLYIA